MPTPQQKPVDGMSSQQDMVVDLLWQVLDPAGYMRMQMDAYQRKNPQAIKSDSKARSYLTLEDQLLENSPGFVEALVNRNVDFVNNVNQGPMTGSQLDRAIMEVLREQTIGSYKNKNSL